MKMTDNPRIDDRRQVALFAISLSIFLIAALAGWIKLRYGFNFIDEGYHMSESWRLAAGDDFFKDKFTGSLLLYVFINSFIFKAVPDITLLAFRELQFGLTIVSLLLMSFALFRVTGRFWFQPLIFSLFAFTGLDPVGMISNLSYYTYPHLFITLHLAFFMIGLKTGSQSLRRLFFILSGSSLWLISFSLLHLSPVVLSPVLLFFIFRKLKTESLDITFQDLCFTLAPFLFFWAVFVGIYHKEYIQNILASLQFLLSTPTHEKGSLLAINFEALKRIITVMLFLFCFLSCTRLPKMISGSLLALLAIVMYFLIDTSLFGLFVPYYQGWFDRPMWFTALLVTSFLMIPCYFTIKFILKKQFNELEIYALILVVPCIIMSICKSIFSAQGILNVLFTAIPAVAAITCMALSLEPIAKRSLTEKFIVLLLLFLPFYYSTSWADWKYTYFDVSPELADAELDRGFGRGIKTNAVYRDLYNWISLTSEKYSQEDDFILSYVVSPMVSMIARRRPSLDNPYISMTESPPYYFLEAIDFMKRRGRKPRLAYIFEAMPCLGCTSLKNDQYAWFGKQFEFPSIDPISEYVSEHMVFIDDFKITGGLTVRCYVDKSYAQEHSLIRETH